MTLSRVSSILYFWDLTGESKLVDFSFTKSSHSAFKAYAITAGSELVRGVPRLLLRQLGVVGTTEH
jgi:hypothetical protein